MHPNSLKNLRFGPGRRNGNFGHYRSDEREDEEGIIERRCVKCGEWMVLELFRKSIECHRGRTRECRACERKRRAVPASPA